MSRTTWVACAIAIAGLAAAGCGRPAADTDGGTTPQTDSGTTLPGDPDGGPGEEPDGGDDPTPTTGGWTFHTHPCAGNRTDTLWVDDDGTAFVGCGSTTAGDQGFYFSKDGGQSWDEPNTNPAGYFDAFRVDDISRSSDGLLYVAGINTGNSHRVVSVDTSAEPWQLEIVLESRPTVGFSFQVGSFRRNADGLAIAESLTGTDILYRSGDDAEWMDGSAWDDDRGGLQILQLVEHEGTFYGAGSLINQPPYLFISNEPGEGFGFKVLQLASGIGEYNGEMWSIAVDQEGIVLGGANQDTDVGMIYALDHDSTATRVMNISVFYEDDASWIRGVCRRGMHLVAVGELSARGEGIVLQSTNDGGTWSVVTPVLEPPASFPPVHRCNVRPDGTVWVAGADGMFAVYTAE